MPAGGSLTQEQIERDVVRIRNEITKLQLREVTLLGTLQEYFPKSAILRLPRDASLRDAIDDAVSMEHLSIADACSVVFKDLSNAWLSLADLDMELKQRGKVCNKGSIEIMLKGEPEKFAIEKRGKRNVYRLKDNGSQK
jgi:hypothetical protein